jgi:hypothetical protein
MKLLVPFLLFAIALFGQGPVVAKADIDLDHSKYDQELLRVQKLVRKWQHRFKMDGIIIGVDVVSQAEVPQYSCGASLYGGGNGFITDSILVVTTKDYNLSEDGCNAADPVKDQENTVVHELLHFVFHFSRNEEFGVSMIANAVIPVKPGKIKPPPKKVTVPKELIFDDYPSHKKY